MLSDDDNYDRINTSLHRAMEYTNPLLSTSESSQERRLGAMRHCRFELWIIILSSHTSARAHRRQCSGNGINAVRDELNN